MKEIPFAVLGTGMAGLGAAYTLDAAGVSFVCYDKNLGGHTRSRRYENGFVFDDGGHISFTKNTHVQQGLAHNMSGRFAEKRLKIDDYWHGHRIPLPVQNNLRNLPAELTVRIIADLMRRPPDTVSGFSTASKEAHGSSQQTYAD